MMDDLKVLSIVVPCFNEEETLNFSADRLENCLQKMIDEGLVSPRSHICFVNDGSTDSSWEIITALRERSRLFRGINLSRNFGHQSALLAGLFTSQADVYVSIDADLQDDETKIIEMVKRFHEGFDVVYGVRSQREADTFFKRTSAMAFYRIRGLMGVNTIPNHADFRLMSRRAVEKLGTFSEVNLYLRGIVPMLGFPSCTVTYERKARELGESKYPLGKMIKLSWNGIVNFTDSPLKFMIWIGSAGFVLSILLIIYAVYRLMIGATLPGWASTVIIVSTFSCLQFLFMGIIGSYIGKIFMETKHRPVFIIQDDFSR